MHFVFLILLAMTALLLMRRARKSVRAPWMTLFFGVLFGLLIAHQALWQLHGAGSVAFQKFRRRFDVRPDTVRANTEDRGRLLARDGSLLAEALPGKRWGHTTPLGPAGLHAVGYSSREYGLSGLERVFDTRLCGFDAPKSARDILKRSRPQDVRTSLMPALQKVAFEALAGRRGAVVALDPRNGDILALVSSPSCTEEELPAAMRNRSEAPLFNRATHGLYPPGSVFKPFTAALVYLLGKEADRYTCPPSGWVHAPYTKPVRDTHPFDDTHAVSLREAFERSSNIWFAKAARAIGWSAFKQTAEHAGLMEPLELARCGERTYATVAGRLPDLSNRPNQMVYLGFGQGDLRLTPMHVAAMTAAIANGGKLAQPRFDLSEPVRTRRIWSAKTADAVAGLMRASVLRGTSRGIALPGLAVCGKTGTAENAGKDHAWFTCFAPQEKPRIVVTVLVENAGYGAAAALPVAKKMLEAWRSAAAQ